MKNYLLHVDKKLLQIIGSIGKEADRKQLSAYVVGGIVRDIILGKKNLDLDIAVEGDAIGLAKTLARKWKVRLTVYKDFQTASLYHPIGIRVDFARTRQERYAHPGALPTVRAGDLKGDLFRRDFTVNAMALSINAQDFGRLVDEFGGLNDIRNKRIRILHDQSFIDDPTRILRAVRFEQRYHFKIEHHTLTLIKSVLKNRGEATVKPPRYFTEFKKIFIESDPLNSIKRLHSLGGLAFLGKGIKIPFQNVKHVHQQIKKMKRKPLYEDHERWELIYFMALIANANNRMINDMLKKFHFTKSERVSIEQSRNTKSIVKKLSGKNLQASHIYKTLKPLPHETVYYLRALTSKDIIARRIDKYLKDHIHMQLKINGKDLKNMGVTPGREIGKVLERILCLKIDKKISTKQEELEAV